MTYQWDIGRIESLRAHFSCNAVGFTVSSHCCDPHHYVTMHNHMCHPINVSFDQAKKTIVETDAIQRHMLVWFLSIDKAKF